MNSWSQLIFPFQLPQWLRLQAHTTVPVPDLSNFSVSLLRIQTLELWVSLECSLNHRQFFFLVVVVGGGLVPGFELRASCIVRKARYRLSHALSP
jgi:hypothetical protein